ncbi:MAG: prolyl oligopeptidase family serine peptidase [Desulfatitalea sp.]|nr:prolyl oligopeptidase family serine peptidase [Desulfatitalea sp.]NNK01682.1 prolyl oligopeptidase family serine peptidase [Desulfatitalea sp.]
MSGYATKKQAMKSKKNRYESILHIKNSFFLIKLFTAIFIISTLFHCGGGESDPGSELYSDSGLLFGPAGDRGIEQDLDMLPDSNGQIVTQLRATIADARAGTTEIYRVRYLSDNLEVVGFIVKPYDNQSNYPVIIFNRGGNREFGKITEDTLEYLSFLSSKGYVVLASQYRGNDGGQGQEEFGGADINDVLNLLPLAKSLPFIDANNIFMLGYSRGGMMTYLAIKSGVEINAAAVVGGLTDLEQAYNEREAEMQRIIEELVGMDPFAWEARSAVHWPEMINIPVLILHGEADERVSVSHATKLAQLLTEEGKVHKLTLFADGNHSLSTHYQEKHTAIFEWFETYTNF